MELLDPNSQPEFTDLPKEVRLQIRESISSRKLDMMQRIACFELGMMNYLNEQDLCDAYNITPQQLAIFRKNNRHDIEKYKESHKLGKLKLMDAISSRMTYADAYAKAMLINDADLASKLRTILTNLDKILPVSQLQDMASILEKMDDTPKDENGGRANIQINVNSAGAQAQRELDELKNGKVIDAS